MTPVFLLVAASLLGHEPTAPETAAPELAAPDGFTVTKFADDDLARDIFCLTHDSLGRVTVAGRGYTKLLLDTDGDGAADTAGQFADGPRDGAQGLCWLGRDLLAVGDEGLLRYRDADGDDRADGPPDRFLKLETGGRARRPRDPSRPRRVVVPDRRQQGRRRPRLRHPADLAGARPGAGRAAPLHPRPDRRGGRRRRDAERLRLRLRASRVSHGRAGGRRDLHVRQRRRAGGLTALVPSDPSVRPAAGHERRLGQPQLEAAGHRLERPAGGGVVRPRLADRRGELPPRRLRPGLPRGRVRRRLDLRPRVRRLPFVRTGRGSSANRSSS